MEELPGPYFLRENGEHKQNEGDEPSAASPILMPQPSAETVVSKLTDDRSPRAADDSPRGMMQRKGSTRSEGDAPIIFRQGSEGTYESAITHAVPDQRNHPTCWIFGITKVILKFLRRFFEKKAGPGRGRLTLPNDGYNHECDQYYDIDKFNASVSETVAGCIKKTSLSSCFETISSGKCGQTEYENLCLHMFIYYIFLKKYGNSGGKSSDALMWFTENFINEQASKAKLNMSKKLPEPYKSDAIGIMEDYYGRPVEQDKPVEPVITPRIFVNTIVYFQHEQMIEVTSNCYRSIPHPLDSSDRIPVIDRKHYYFCESGRIERSPSGPGDPDLAERVLSKYIKSVLKQKLYLTVTIDLTGDSLGWWKNLIKRLRISGFNETSVEQPEYKGCSFTGKLGDPAFMDRLRDIGLHTMTIIGCETRNGKLFLKIKNSWGLKWGRYGIIVIGMEELMTHCFLQFTCMDDVDFIEIMEKMILDNIKAKNAERDKAPDESLNKQREDRPEAEAKRPEAERAESAQSIFDARIRDLKKEGDDTSVEGGVEPGSWNEEIPSDSDENESLTDKTKEPQTKRFEIASGETFGGARRQVKSCRISKRCKKTRRKQKQTTSRRKQTRRKKQTTSRRKRRRGRNTRR